MKLQILKKKSLGEINYNLLMGYWENNIQCRMVYQFNKDGTVNEYSIEFDQIVNEKNLDYSRTLYYYLSDGKLVIDWGNRHQSILEIVTTDSPIDWDIGLQDQISEIPDNTQFLYETGWVDNGIISDNAMYLIKVSDF